MSSIDDYQLLCNILVRRYAKQMGIPDNKIPKVYTTQEEFNKADICDGTKLGEGKLKASGHFGIYCEACNIIFSNPKLCKTLPKIIESIIHEKLIHAKWFHTMNHGKRYDRRIELIIEGKRYK